MRLDERNPRHQEFDVTMTDPYAASRSSQGASLSGHERNDLFLNRGGKGFEKVSGVSGFDAQEDGRALALFDYDRDGWLDLAVANSNAPLLQIFRNQIAELPGVDPKQHRMVALHLVGGNRTAAPSEEFSTRDGYGAVAELQVGDATLLRELRAGEGFATQNSSILRVGIGDADGVDRIRVRWPSGRVQEIENVPAESLVTVYENPADAPDGAGVQVAAYRVPGVAERVAARLGTPPSEPRTLALADGNGTGEPRLRLVTTMATWCKVCRGELPQIARLREAFGPDELDLVAVPIDEDDTRAKLDAYELEYTPAYTLLKDLSPEQVAEVKGVVVDALRVDALPATIVTDGSGHVLRTRAKLPSVSEVRAYLSGMRS